MTFISVIISTPVALLCHILGWRSTPSYGNESRTSTDYVPISSASIALVVSELKSHPPPVYMLALIIYYILILSVAIIARIIRRHTVVLLDRIS